MALLGNYSVLNKGPGRAFSGTVAADTRANFGKPGALRGRYAQTGGFTPQTSVPSATRPPYCWQIAITPGSIGSKKRTIGTSDGSVNLAGGRNAQLSAAGSSTATATGALVSSAIASSVGGTTTAATVTGILSAIASAAGASTNQAALTGVGHMQPTAAGEGATLATVTATGQVIAASTTAGAADVLDVDAIAAAIWTETMTNYDTPGSFGQRLRELFPQHWGIH